MNKWILFCALGIVLLALAGRWHGPGHGGALKAVWKGNALEYTRYQGQRRIFSMRATSMQSEAGATAEFNQVQISFFNAEDRVFSVVQCQRLEASADRKRWRSDRPVQIEVQFPGSSLGAWAIQARSLQFDEASGMLRAVDVTGREGNSAQLTIDAVQMRAGEERTALEGLTIWRGNGERLQARHGMLLWKEKILQLSQLHTQWRDVRLQAGAARMPLDASGIRALQASDGVNLRESSEGVQRTTESQQLEITLDEDGRLLHSHSHGQVRYEEAAHGKTPAWEARGADAQVDEKTSTIVLQGAAQVQDADMLLFAGNMQVQRITGEVLAHDSVEVRRTETDGSETRIRSRSASLRRAMGVAHFVGATRLTNANGSIEAPYMSLQWLRHTIKADADAEQFVEIHWQMMGSGDALKTLHSTSQHLSCDSEAHHAHLSGNVQMEQDEEKIQATRMDLDFEPIDTDGRLETRLLRWSAAGKTRWQSGIREATAEEIVCEEAQRNCILHGANAWMREGTTETHQSSISFTP